MTCFIWYGRDGINRLWHVALCANNPVLVFSQNNGGYDYYKIQENGIDLRPGYVLHSGGIQSITSQLQYDSFFLNGAANVKDGNCNNCPPTAQVQYDCINGVCTTKTTYNTPGLYTSLSACETACGTGCSGVCISHTDMAQLIGLSNELRTNICG